MITSLKSFIYNFRTHPLRGILTLLTITIGIGTLIITNSLNMDINQVLRTKEAESGKKIVIANGELNDNGSFQQQFPTQFTSSIDGILSTGYENLSDISYVAEAWVGNRISVNKTSYQFRTAIQASETYANLMDLEISAGIFFTKEDVNSRKRVLVISEQTAKLLFQSSDAALGQTMLVQSKDGENPYKIIGVYKQVSELERQVYRVGDIIFPIGAGLPLKAKIHPIQYGAVIMAKVKGDSVKTAESRIRTMLEFEYGDDLSLSVWEGSVKGPDLTLEESRQSVSRFALAVNILGVLILAISSIGIFSVMLVEVLNRTREIGLRRALGTSKAGIRKYFIGQALYYSIFGSIIGIIISFILYKGIGTFLTPLFDSAGFRISDLSLSVPGGVSIVLAVGAALIFGVLFGFFPAYFASNTPIIECIKYDAV